MGVNHNESPIIARWGISGWPTIYVIDVDGIIRFQTVDFPNEERFEEVVDDLLRELEGKPEPLTGHRSATIGRVQPEVGSWGDDVSPVDVILVPKKVVHAVSP